MASQRILEVPLAELADTGEGATSVAQATRSGITEAIDFVSRVVGGDWSEQVGAQTFDGGAKASDEDVSR